MVDSSKEEALSAALKAVSDATRRSLLTQLVQQGPTRVTDLANLYNVSLNAISKHIKVLERAELVIRRTVGRTHLIEANLGPVIRVDHWFHELKSLWTRQLEGLDNLPNSENDSHDASGSQPG